MLLVCVTSFSFSVKPFLYFIDQDKNEMMPIEHLETGLPFFLVRPNGTVIFTNSFGLMNGEEENVTVYCEKIKPLHFSGRKHKDLTFKYTELDREEFLKAKVYQRVLKALYTAKCTE